MNILFGIHNINMSCYATLSWILGFLLRLPIEYTVTGLCWGDPFEMRAQYSIQYSSSKLWNVEKGTSALNKIVL